MRLAPGTRLGDRYTILSSLGRGGVATVWLARHEHLHTLHALKVLSLGSERLQQRLVNEARIQAMLKHPNVVAAVDLVPIAGGVGLVLDYVNGPSLRALLGGRRLEPAEADLLFRDVAAGVSCAHGHGLVHRDLKPANVLLQLEPELVAKVTDFGLAKLWAVESGSDGTRTGATLGTPAYMAPEQVRDAASVDARADVFALGSLAYELLTGIRAFEGEDTADTLNRVKETRYRSLRQLDATLPESMIRAVEGALVADPDRRFPSVEAMLEVWGDHGADAGVRARLTADARRIHAAAPAQNPADQTWTETDAPPSRGPRPPSSPVPASTQTRTWPGWSLPLGAGLVFVAGMGAATVWSTSPPPLPPPVPVRAPLLEVAEQAPILAPIPVAVATPPPTAPTALEAPSPPLAPQLSPAQRAAAQLSFLMTDLSTDAIRGKRSRDWLSHGLAQRIAEADALAADIRRQYPNDEAALQADYTIAMIRFVSYGYLAWVSPPASATPEEAAEWKEAAEKEYRPAAYRYLDEATLRFEALAHSDHPRAADSLWPRVGRQMAAQIEEIPRL